MSQENVELARGGYPGLHQGRLSYPFPRSEEPRWQVESIYPG